MKPNPQHQDTPGGVERLNYMKLNNILKNYNLSLSDLARQTNISKGYLSGLTDFSGMSVKLAGRMARFLNLSIDELINGYDTTRKWEEIRKENIALKIQLKKINALSHPEGWGD